MGPVEFEEQTHHMHYTAMILSLVVAGLGIFLSYLTYYKKKISADNVAAKFKGLHTFLYNKWYFDELYGSVVVGVSSVLQVGGLVSSEAFRWTKDSGKQSLGDLAGDGLFSTAYGVSGDGSVVVGSGRDASGERAFIWDEADEVVRLARISHPRITIDTSGLTPKATELANRLADDIGKLDAATLDELVAILGRKRPKPRG